MAENKTLRAEAVSSEMTTVTLEILSFCLSVYFCMYEYAVDLSHSMLTFEQITILNLVAAIETNSSGTGSIWYGHGSVVDLQELHGVCTGRLICSELDHPSWCNRPYPTPL